ncbi:MAG: sensor domain-containing diguanylate cyclase [Alphaproteobacteria bacterium]|nr:sensor domain-containing diguanylate cyclase [Alphaproteobacteria bacterium]
MVSETDGVMATSESVASHEQARLEELESFDVLDTRPEEAFDSITRLAQTAIGTPIVLVSLVDKERQWFKSRQGLDAEETPRDISFCTHAIASDDVFVVEDAAEHPLFKSNPLVTGDPNIRFYAGAPLKTSSGYRIGTLCAIDRVPRGLSDTEEKILVELASLVVREMELRKIAALDGLTGAMSRSNYMTLCNRELARSKRHGHDMSVLVLDLDHFKNINDTYGHPAGDQVLKVIARLCLSELREHDLFGRIGGEEFSMLLPETGQKGAIEVAERTRAGIEALDILWVGHRIQITSSIGVASMNETDHTIREIISRADAALYDAKGGGRNQVQVRF